MANDGLTEARLRELYRDALEARRAPDRKHCVAPEAMLAVLRREGPEEQRLEVLDHVMGCAACRSEFDLLRSIEQAGADVERPALLRIFPRATWRSVAPFALAASVVLAVTAGLALRPRDAPDVERGAANGVVLLAPAAEIAAEPPLTFSWRPVPGARGYELEVLDEKGAVVFARKTTETALTLPELRPGASYRWWVRATISPGDQVASELRPLRLRSK